MPGKLAVIAEFVQLMTKRLLCIWWAHAVPQGQYRLHCIALQCLIIWHLWSLGFSHPAIRLPKFATTLRPETKRGLKFVCTFLYVAALVMSTCCAAGPSVTRITDSPPSTRPTTGPYCFETRSRKLSGSSNMSAAESPGGPAGRIACLLLVCSDLHRKNKMQCLSSSRGLVLQNMQKG